MKILIALVFILFNSFFLFARKQLLIYYPEKEHSLMCDYKFIDDTILVLSSFKYIENNDLEEKIPLLKSVNSITIYALRISRLNVSKEDIKSEVNILVLKTPDSIIVKKTGVSDMKLRQIVSVDIGDRQIICGNLHNSVKKLNKLFAKVTVIKINSGQIIL